MLVLLAWLGCAVGHDAVEMQKRRICLGLLLLAVVVGVGLFVASLFREREPEYEGKSLSHWVEAINPDSRAFPPVAVRPTAESDAISHLGTNSLPYLLNWICYEQPSWKTNLLTVIKKTFHCTLDDHQSRRAERAAWALTMLHTNAEKAIPSLAALMNSPTTPIGASRTTMALMGLQNDLPSAAMALTTNRYPKVRRESIGLLLLRDASIAVFIQYLADTDETVAQRAAWELGEVARQPNLAVPALIESLKDKRPSIRRTAIMALGRFHNQARLAIPALMRLRKDPDPEIAMLASYTFRTMIDRDVEPASQISKLMDNFQVAQSSNAEGLMKLASEELRKFGPESRSAVPVLLDFITDDNPTTRALASNVLRQIDPQALEKPKEAVR